MVGKLFTVTVSVVVPTHPFPSVPETEYVLVTLGVKATPLLTPPDQVYVLAPEALKETLSPAQRVLLGLAVMDKVGIELTLMVKT